MTTCTPVLSTPQPAPSSQKIAVRAGTPSLGDLAGTAKADRNRAIDLYRAIAMLAVALGHWMAMNVAVDASGDLVAGNALEQAPGMAVLTWLFQVMPLFFVVGGFSSAMSLDAFFRNASSKTLTRDEGRDPDHQATADLANASNKSTTRDEGRDPDHQATADLANASSNADWVAARLRRMLAPAIALATTWAVLIAAGFAIGQGELIAIGATAAAIPLWFLANYTIDTAIAPFVLPLFRKHPVALPVIGVATFCSLEAARFAGVPALPHLNWILGWLLFQVAGFAWRDGLLPTGRAMAATATGFWIAAVTAVTVGPWPVSMVHFPGLENSPTHPPSLALMLFGAAYSCTAILVAPAVSAWLAARPKAWSAVVAGNTVAMSVYLWHFTAAIAASALFHVAGWLPTAAVGTTDWWIQKLPLMGVSALILAAIVARVMPIERDALLAPRTPWIGGPISMLVVAGVLSTALKQWAHGDFGVATGCIALLLVLWHGLIKTNAIAARATSETSETSDRYSAHSAI